MQPTPSDGAPVWPPKPEDLRRLYVDERLSAAKIAVRYGLKYASPKTAESTVLYQLKKNGISRRDKAELARKVTEEMVDDWVKRYKAGESLKRIAGDEVNHVTVFNHLRKRGLQLRDKVEAQIEAVTKHPKKPFDGDPRLRAYLVGISKGDYWVTNHGRATRVRLGTTHPEMSALFRQLFQTHGPIYEYPKRAPLTGFEWCLDCDLDDSFAFLADSAQLIRVFEDKDSFLNFLAGFFDAEGSVYYHKKNGIGSFECSIANSDGDIMRRITSSLTDLGFNPKIRMEESTPKRIYRGGEMVSTLPMWRVGLWRHEEVRRLLNELPIKHPEKVAKAKIALQLAFRPNNHDREKIIAEWESLKSRIRTEVADYIRKAGEELDRRRNEQT